MKLLKYIKILQSMVSFSKIFIFMKIFMRFSYYDSNCKYEQNELCNFALPYFL